MATKRLYIGTCLTSAQKTFVRLAAASHGETVAAMLRRLALGEAARIVADLHDDPGDEDR